MSKDTYYDACKRFRRTVLAFCKTVTDALKFEFMLAKLSKYITTERGPWIDIKDEKLPSDKGPLEVKGCFGASIVVPFQGRFIPLSIEVTADNITHWRLHNGGGYKRQ